ncbi:NAPDH-dependent diflavin reductase [Marasmius crinis-equi]|uniref:NADPH-dependent diflavin oxidoreductase 1 n=1 Tax=Marasmius crinis-equi TaxID=585013 RepID=A0ABR3F853_9AGAR
MFGDDDRDILILYATETGTAQDAADRIARHCRRGHLRSRVLSVDQYTPADLISENIVIFVISTTGSGLEPRSMKEMWTMLLRSDLPNDLFEDLQFAVFGLGDTAYEKFCWPAKRLFRRLKSLGAEEICDLGEGDEQHHLGLNGALDPWIKNLFEALLQVLPLPPGLEAHPADETPPARVSISAASPSPLVDDSLNGAKGYHDCVVTCNDRITAEDWYQDVRHLEFTFREDIEYSPGDIAVIRPKANPDEVDEFLTSMDWGDISDGLFNITHVQRDQSLPEHLPPKSSLREVFTRYLDFNAVPRRSFFQYLRYFTEDTMEIERLNEFLSDSGADDLYEYCYQVRRTIREVLSEFRGVKIPKEYIFDVFPPLRPREFSIASAIKKHPRQIHLCVAIVKYRTKLRVPRRGVCSKYLSALKPGDSIKIGLKEGFIKLPSDRSTPVICVGPGTGIAPMRAVLEERIFHQSYNNTLYFGCRSANKDQHYRIEWEEYKALEQLTYRVACSRDVPEGVKRTYVQALIEEDGERIWELLEQQKAWVLISGSSNKMPTAVKEALRLCAEEKGKKTASESAEYVRMLERTGRLIEECWS